MLDMAMMILSGRFACGLLAGAVSLLMALGLEGQVMKADRPNVLFVAIDDLRTALGCYGDELAITRRIDDFADSGLRFARAYCNQAVCGPSRASLLTGRLPDHIRVWHNRDRFRDTLPDLVTLPELFKNHGYHTQSIGKVFSGRTSEEDPQSWSIPSTRNRENWQSYVLSENQGSGKQAPTERADVPDEAYRDGQIAKFAIETLEKLKQAEQPFFLAVGFSKPHLPFNAPSKYWDLYDPKVFARDVDSNRTKGAPEAAYSEQMELGGYRGVPEDETVGFNQAVELRHGYYACVSYVDTLVGKMLDALERLELDESTIVVLLGDHGFSLGEAGHWCKKTNFEMDTRVPLIIRARGTTGEGVATDALIELVDIYPTLAELAGLPLPDDLDGQSLAPVLRDPSHGGRKFALSQHSRPFKRPAPEIMGYSIRSWTGRYTRWLEWPSRKLIAEELYDYGSEVSALQTEGYFVEKENLILKPAYEEQRALLRKEMDQILVERQLLPAN